MKGRGSKAIMLDSLEPTASIVKSSFVSPKSALIQKGSKTDKLKRKHTNFNLEPDSPPRSKRTVT